MWQRLVMLSLFFDLAVAILPGQDPGQFEAGQIDMKQRVALEDDMLNTRVQHLSEDQVYGLVKLDKQHPDVLEKVLHDDGVDFDLNSEIEKKMRKAGANDEILQAIWAAGPTARNFKGATLNSATGAPLTSTYKEAMGYKTLEQTSDPDTKIRMAMEFAQTFPKSELLSYVFTQAAAAFQQKGDYLNAVKTGEKSVELDPDNVYSLLIVATAVSEPSVVSKASDSAKALQEAQTDAQRALDLSPKLAAWPSETPDQFAARKSGLESTAHAALGSVAMQQDKPDQAIEEFNKAIALSQPPKASLYFRLGEVYSNTGKKQEAIGAFSKAAELGKGTVIETYANQSLKELRQN